MCPPQLCLDVSASGVSGCVRLRCVWMCPSQVCLDVSASGVSGCVRLRCVWMCPPQVCLDVSASGVSGCVRLRCVWMCPPQVCLGVSASGVSGCLRLRCVWMCPPHGCACRQVELEEQYEVVQTLCEVWTGRILLAEHRASRHEVILKALHKVATSRSDFLREFHYR